MCVLSVFLSAAAAGTHASPPHHDTHQTLFSCSPDLLLTFPPSSPPPTLTHTQTHNTLLNPCFSLLAGQLSVPVLCLSPPSSTVPHSFLSLSLSVSLSLSLTLSLAPSLSPSLSLAQTPRQLVSGELNIDLAGLSMPGE